MTIKCPKCSSCNVETSSELVETFFETEDGDIHSEDYDCDYTSTSNLYSHNLTCNDCGHDQDWTSDSKEIDEEDLD